jgi:hypothetical protein
MESAASFSLVVAMIKRTVVGDNERHFRNSDGAPYHLCFEP